MMAVYEAANQRKDNEKGEGMVTADNEDAISEPSKTTRRANTTIDYNRQPPVATEDEFCIAAWREIMTFACILTDI